MPCTYDRDLGDAPAGEGITVPLYHREDVYVEVADAWLERYGEGFYCPVVTAQDDNDPDLCWYCAVIFSDPDTAFAFKVRFF